MIAVKLCLDADKPVLSRAKRHDRYLLLPGVRVGHKRASRASVQSQLALFIIKLGQKMRQHGKPYKPVGPLIRRSLFYAMKWTNEARDKPHLRVAYLD